MKLYSEIKSGLTSKSREQRVGSFASDDLGDRFGVQRLDVGCIGDLRVGHDGSGIGVDEDYVVTLVAQGPTGLRPRVVELGGLTNNYWT